MMITCSVYMLCEHPQLESRLRNEILSVVGETGRPTYDSLKQMKFLRAFLNGTVLFC